MEYNDLAALEAEEAGKDIFSLKKYSSALRQVTPAHPRRFRTKKADLGYDIDPIELLKALFGGNSDGSIRIKRESIPDEFDPHRDDFEERRRQARMQTLPESHLEEEEDPDEAFEALLKKAEDILGFPLQLPESETENAAETSEPKVEVKEEEASIVRVEMLPPFDPTFSIHFPVLYRISFKHYLPVYFQIHTLEDNEDDLTEMMIGAKSSMLFLSMKMSHDAENEPKKRRKRLKGHHFSKLNPTRKGYTRNADEFFQFYQIGIYIGTETMMVSNVIDESNMFMYCDLFDVKDFNFDSLLNLNREEESILLALTVHDMKRLMANEPPRITDHNELIFKDTTLAALMFPPKSFSDRKKIVTTLHRAGYSAKELSNYLKDITNIEVSHNASLTVRVKGEETDEETDERTAFERSFAPDPRWTEYLIIKKEADKAKARYKRQQKKLRSENL